MSHTKDWRLNVISSGKNWNRSRSRQGVFKPVKIAAVNPGITGITRDKNGVALGNCIVDAFRNWDNQFIASTISDGGGNFTVNPISSGPYYLVAYKAGSPDVAGTSVNTLIAA